MDKYQKPEKPNDFTERGTQDEPSQSPIYNQQNNQPSQPPEITTTFKVLWGFIGFFFGMLSIIFILIGTARKGAYIRNAAFRYAAVGFLVAIAFEFLLFTVFGDQTMAFMQQILDAQNGASTSVSTSSSAVRGSVF